MRVYIDMEMPKSCKACDLLQDYDGDMYCPLNNYLNFGDIDNVPDYVMDGCKLVEVPEPHGRLIDASEKIRVQMYDDMTEDYHIAEMTIDDLLSQGWVEADAPTIIPASEEGE